MLLPADIDHAFHLAWGFGNGIRRITRSNLPRWCQEVVLCQRVFNRQDGGLFFDVNLGLFNGITGGGHGFGDNGVNNLAMIRNLTFGEHRVITKNRADIINPGNIISGQHHDHAGGLPHVIKIKRSHDTGGNRAQPGDNHQPIFRHGQIIKVTGLARDMKGRAIMGD